MKKAFWMLVAIMIALPFIVQAQPPQGPPPPPTAEERAVRLEKLAKDLNLTEEQKAKFKQAENDFFAKAEKLQGEIKPQMDTLHKERDEAVKTILTAEQYAQLQKIHEDRRKQGPPPPKKN